MTGTVWCFALMFMFVITNNAEGWVWKCDEHEGLCTRTTPDKSHPTKTDNAHVRSTDYFPSLEVCRLLCGDFKSLWPKPTGHTKFGNTLIKFDTRNLVTWIAAPASVTEILNEMKDIFVDNVNKKGSNNCAYETQLNLKLSAATAEEHLGFDINESYMLEIDQPENTDNVVSVDITATTIFGARHALETLSQLIEPYTNADRSTCFVIPTEVAITDSPSYGYRGLLLDSARNFLPVSNILKHLDAMAASKMNVFHWHITDSQSWPLEISSIPNMTRFGAYSQNQIYRPEDIKQIIDYAYLRGIEVIPEIDAPSHSGNGWQWGPDANQGHLAVCVNQEPWRSYCIEPPCGQLNPANPNLYTALEKIYGDVNNMFTRNNIFHMGGDEVFFPCWNSSQPILEYIKGKPRTLETFLDLWSEYQEKALEAFDKSREQQSTPIIVWNSHLTDPSIIEKYLPKDRYVIQTWVPNTDHLPDELHELGYRLIISTKNAWYLDHGFWKNTPYYDWMTVYKNRIIKSNQVLGGEVCMWGEYVDATGIESRVWPRAAAAAERLWSNPNSFNSEVTARFYRHRERLVSKGIKADAVGPRWCYQNEGACT